METQNLIKHRNHRTYHNSIDSGQVVLIRHAQSQWNRENRFTGWADPPLTDAGIAEAVTAGEWLHNNGYHFDVAYSSRLQRAIATLDILLEQIGQSDIESYTDWRLNERHYGVLQGMNKTDAINKVGVHQVWRWRRGYEDQAAPLLRTDPAHPVNMPMYADVDRQRLPGVESLAHTRARVMTFWDEQVAPRIHRGEQILISAHGNTLRALLMDLTQMSVDQVESFEIPTAAPILVDSKNHQSFDWHYL
ncbi:MAG: 2,3-bisphosphoglycerate-dependent phosphoglycerate mutase [Thioalkalispiraceae bacterium]|jgi:2,3-bisphosphoglycerate-dependent phosphoglycerate mutase